jgi:hypothetical protein
MYYLKIKNYKLLVFSILAEHQLYFFEYDVI